MQESHRIFTSTKVWLLPLFLFLLLAVPAKAHAGREVHFIQATNYCNPPIGYLQGQLTLFNPSSELVTIQLTGNLLYGTTGNVPQQDSKTATFSIAPGQTAYYQINNNVTAYGCHGTARFFGTVRIAGDTRGIVALSGNVLTTEVTLGSNIIQSVNIPFNIPSQAYNY